MNRIQKIAILSISLLAIMSSAAISPTLPYIGDYFSDASELLVKMVISLPAIFIIPVTLITGRLIFYIKKKHLLYMGLSLFLIGGLGGALQNSIYMLLAFRAIMGIGIGLMLPLTRGIIADLFTGNDRAKMMGFSTAVNSLGGIIATVFAGILTIFGWRYPFLVYILGFVVLFLVIVYLPNQDIPSKETHKIHINRKVWLLGLSHFTIILMFYAVPSGLGFYIIEKELGSGVTTGLLISLVTIGSFLFGIYYYRIRTMFKGGTVLLGLILSTVGMFGIGLSYNLFGLSVALLFVGFGLGILAPNIYLQTSLDSNKNDITLSLAIVSCFSFLGQFSSPIINSFIQKLFNYYTVESTFTISTFIGVFGIIIVIINKFVKVYTAEKEGENI